MSPEAASLKGNTVAEGDSTANVPAAPTPDRQRIGELLTAFASPASGNNFEAKRYSVLMKYADTLKVSANKLFQYGLDLDNVPFAQTANGTKGRFVNLSPNHFRLQIVKGRGIGEVEFTRLSNNETLTRFMTVGGDTLLIRTRTQTGNDGATGINVGFQYKNESVVLKLDERSTEKGFAPYAEKELRVMLSRVRKNRALKELRWSNLTGDDALARIKR